jgi:hypothetical protein
MNNVRTTMMKKWMHSAKAFLAFVAMCWTAVLLIESARGSSFYPRIRDTMRFLGEAGTYLLHDSRVLTFRDPTTGKQFQNRLTATGLFVVNRHPPMGTQIHRPDGDYVLVSVERSGMPVLPNILLSAAPLVYAGVAARRRDSVRGVFAIGKHWYTRIVSWLFVAWGVFATINLVLRVCDHIAQSWTNRRVYTLMAVVCIASWGLTYICRFVKCEQSASPLPRDPRTGHSP